MIISRWLRKGYPSRQGASAVEYMILVALLALAIVVAAKTMGDGISKSFSDASYGVDPGKSPGGGESGVTGPGGGEEQGQTEGPGQATTSGNGEEEEEKGKGKKGKGKKGKGSRSAKGVGHGEGKGRGRGSM